VRTLKTFQGTHILDASRGLLCDSSAVLFNVQIKTRVNVFKNFFNVFLFITIPAKTMCR